MLVEVERPKRGKFGNIGCPPKLSAYAPEVKPAPMLGENTDEILKEVGYSDAEIAKFRADHVVCK